MTFYGFFGIILKLIIFWKVVPLFAAFFETIYEKSDHAEKSALAVEIIMFEEIFDMARIDRNICKNAAKMWIIPHFPKRKIWKILWRQHLRF